MFDEQLKARLNEECRKRKWAVVVDPEECAREQSKRPARGAAAVHEFCHGSNRYRPSSSGSVSYGYSRFTRSTRDRDVYDSDQQLYIKSNRGCFPKPVYYKDTIFEHKLMLADDLAYRLEYLLKKRRERDAVEETRQFLLRGLKNKQFEPLKDNANVLIWAESTTVDIDGHQVQTGIVKIMPNSNKGERSLYSDTVHYFVLSGEVRVTINGVPKSEPCSTGQEILIPELTHYQIENISRVDPAYLYYKLRHNKNALPLDKLIVT